MILRGMVKLARGNPKGFEEFGATPEAFTASLAPLIAFPVVGALLMAIASGWKMALLGLLSRLCSVLILPVLTYEFARLFGRQSQWLRTATAMNWCLWLLIPAMFVAILLGVIAAEIGAPQPLAEFGTLMLAGLYLLWNRWYIFKAGLEVNGWRAGGIILVSLVLGALFTLLPIWAGLPMPGLNGAPLP